MRWTVLTANPIKSVYKRLRDVGLTKPYVKKVALPSWWDDSLAENPAGYAQCLMILSRHLGLDLKTLQQPQSTLRLRDFGVCKYKKRKGTTDDELLLSRVIATRAAQLAGAALEKDYAPIPASACDIRQAILDGAPWVGLEELLDYCWSVGIPVLHVNYFPPGAKRPDGFTLSLHGRPVIVLCRNEKQPSWLLFILAHELGHIACGHVPVDGALLDERLQDNEPDDEEREANRFALKLLTGKATTRIGTSGRWLNMRELAELATAYGQRNSIDPGHVVLNYAYSMGNGFFSVARGALNHLYPNADALETVRNRLAVNLDWEQLPEDSSDFLMRITRQSQETDE
jgi:IrrE N-terminal-like domain